MMCTRTIATGAGITGSADCPPAFLRSSSLGPLGLWCCAVSSPAAAHLVPTHAQSPRALIPLVPLIRSLISGPCTAPPTLWGHLRVPRLPYAPAGVRLRSSASNQQLPSHALKQYSTTRGGGDDGGANDDDDPGRLGVRTAVRHGWWLPTM